MILEKLPTELISLVYSFLPPEDVARLSQTCKRLQQMINQDATYWQHACDSLGPPSHIWYELQTNSHKKAHKVGTACQELQMFIWHYKTAQNWSRQSYRFYRVSNASADEHLNVWNEAELMRSSCTGKLELWNLANRELDKKIRLPSTEDLRIKVILGKTLMILVDRARDFYSLPIIKKATPQLSWPMFKKATPRLLFKTREHKYNYWADDLSYAGTINSTAIFWLDEPDDLNVDSGTITIKNVNGATHDIVDTTVFSYNLRYPEYDDVHRDQDGEPMDQNYQHRDQRVHGIEAVLINHWIIFVNGCRPFAVVNNTTGRVTHLEATPHEDGYNLNVWKNMLMNCYRVENYLVIWDLASGKIVYKTTGSFVLCRFTTLPDDKPLIMSLRQDKNETKDGYRPIYSIHFFKAVGSELVEDQDMKIVIREIPDVMNTLEALFKKQSLAKSPSQSRSWCGECAWWPLGLKVLLNKYLAFLFHIDANDHLTILLFKLDSLHTPPIIIPLLNGPKLEREYFQDEHLILDKFDSTHIIIRFSSDYRNREPELFYIYDFAP